MNEELDESSQAGHPTPKRNDGKELHHLLPTSAIEEGGRAIVSVQEREVAVFNYKGAYFAYENFCVHQGGPVCEGPIKGKFSVDENFELVYDEDDQYVTCPWHGWEFSVETGGHVNQTGYDLIAHELVVQDGEIYVVL